MTIPYMLANYKVPVNLLCLDKVFGLYSLRPRMASDWTSLYPVPCNLFPRLNVGDHHASATPGDRTPDGPAVCDRGSERHPPDPRRRVARCRDRRCRPAAAGGAQAVAGVAHSELPA